MHRSRIWGCAGVFVIGVALVAISSCRSRPPQPPPYEPTASLSVEEAKEAIARSLEEQPQGYAASHIEMTDRKLSFDQGKNPLFRRATQLPVVFYWDTLGKMDVTPKRKGHVVRVWDKDEVYRFRVVIPDPERAKRFMDAMLVMSLSGP